MPRRSELPAVFGKLCAQLQYVQQVSNVEYSAECPACGGTVHQDGEWPDRLRIFMGTKPRCWCRRCNHFAWADEINGQQMPKKEDLEQWRQEQIRREEERKRSAELALANLRKYEVWERYYNQLPGAGEAYWLKRGIPHGWQAFWWLGWNPDSWWNCPTATIPIFDQQRQVCNIKHRLIGNDVQGQKYRYQLHGLPAPLWLADPEAPLTGAIVAVEGEVKAMVVKVTLDDSTTVVGLPGTSPGAAVIQQLKQAERVTLVLDPGTELAENGEPSVAQRLVTAIGTKHCRLLIPGMKIDDAVLASSMTRFDLRHTLAQARQV